jgi:tyrosinase
MLSRVITIPINHIFSNPRVNLNMMLSSSYLFTLLGLLGVAQAAPLSELAACTTKTAHKPWQLLTSTEKTAFIDAELCLMKAPSKLNKGGAKTRWDDLQYNHVIQTHIVHDVGHFLPWHRYYVAIHGWLLRDECGYTGPLP